MPYVVEVQHKKSKVKQYVSCTMIYQFDAAREMAKDGLDAAALGVEKMVSIDAIWNDTLDEARKRPFKTKKDAEGMIFALRNTPPKAPNLLYRVVEVKAA